MKAQRISQKRCKIHFLIHEPFIQNPNIRMQILYIDLFTFPWKTGRESNIFFFTMYRYC